MEEAENAVHHFFRSNEWNFEEIVKNVGEPEEYGFDCYEDFEEYVEVALVPGPMDFQRYVEEATRPI